MAFEISDAFKKQYNDTLALLVQQTASRLSPFVWMKAGYTGEGVQPLKQVGLFDFETKTGRLQQTPTREPAYFGRWVAPVTKWAAPIIDRNDKFSLGFDPSSDLMKALKAGAARAKDDVIIPAILGTARTGKDGATNTSLPSSQVIGTNIGGTGSNLNRDKLIAAMELFQANDVDVEAEQPCIGLSPKANSALLRQLDVTDSTNKLSGRIENGRVVEVGGFRCVHSNRYAAAANVRDLPAWVPSGVHLGVWDDLVTRIDERMDLGYAWQLFGQFIIGATRTEEKKVVKVQVTEG